ncbi:hypothetical protein, partial [Aeromonas veronii]|uniref:hypothetical protein n=1 Tax=Aeromonas veronii TaxID=654 RepID=UPI001F418E9B
MGMLGTTLERSKIDVTINQQSAQQAREIHRHETGETLDRNESEIVTRQARSWGRCRKKREARKQDNKKIKKKKKTTKKKKKKKKK